MTLRKLIEVVEAGEWPDGLVIPAPFTDTPQTGYAVTEAFHGSLDAAKALHDALLPGWDWTMHGNGQAALWPPGSIDEQNAGCIEADIEGQPARALLLAILRALEGGKG